MGIRIYKPLRQSYRSHQLTDSGIDRLFIFQDLVFNNGLRNGLTHSLLRIQRRKRILKDDLHIPAHLPHLTAAQSRDVLAIKDHLAVSWFQKS